MITNKTELSKVFNFDISNKLNDKCKSIYICVNKDISYKNFLLELEKIKILELNIELKTIFNKIITTKTKETLITIQLNNKQNKKTDYNLIISLYEKQHLIAINLFNSLINHKLRNINFYLINNNSNNSINSINSTLNIIYSIIEHFLIYLYNYNNKFIGKSNNFSTDLNFYINILSLMKEKEFNDVKININNIIFDTKTIFICKQKTASLTTNKLPQIKKKSITLKSIKSKPSINYYEYKPINLKNKLVVFSSNNLTHVLHAFITNNALKNTKNNVKNHIIVINDLDELKKLDKLNFTDDKLLEVIVDLFGKTFTYLDFKKGNSQLKYSEKTPINMVDKIFDTVIKNNIPLTMKKIPSLKQYKHINEIKYIELQLKNECMSIKILSNI